ncbi:hypothetical protein GCM10009741_71180 [Kribbella lupini]|uniref:Uncharacterized protein n=1 Tax=Kribbella lupini TaxID=291602 RepID=A0ABP4N6A0_9ACTN
MFGSVAATYFTYDGLLDTTPSIEIRFGALSSFQLTCTAVRAWSQATETPVGIGSDEQAVRTAAPSTVAATTAGSDRTLPIAPHLPSGSWNALTIHSWHPGLPSRRAES